jgi:antitoxin ParD1/3/4
MPKDRKLTFALIPQRSRRCATRGLAIELQRLWQEGISSGPGRFTSIDQIKKEARRRVQKAR